MFIVTNNQHTMTTILLIREIFPWIYVAVLNVMYVIKYLLNLMSTLRERQYFVLQNITKMIETNILIKRCCIYHYLSTILHLNVTGQNLCILWNAIFFVSAVEILRNPYDVPVDSYQAFKVKHRIYHLLYIPLKYVYFVNMNNNLNTVYHHVYILTCNSNES